MRLAPQCCGKVSLGPELPETAKGKGGPLMKLLPGKVSKKRPPILESLHTDQNLEHDSIQNTQPNPTFVGSYIILH